jgi:UDPglucose 6-dehydrogenase
MRVTMIGAGYVGLVSGACFADFGHHVTCIDKDAKKVAALNNGEIPIFEPGLDDLVLANVRQERLHFATDTAAVRESDAVFIAVGTPAMATPTLPLCTRRFGRSRLCCLPRPS